MEGFSPSSKVLVSVVSCPSFFGAGVALPKVALLGPGVLGGVNEIGGRVVVFDECLCGGVSTLLLSVVVKEEELVNLPRFTGAYYTIFCMGRSSTGMTRGNL